MRTKDVLFLLCSALLVVLFGFYGCGDSTDEGTGTGTGSEWMPLTDGNSWTYKFVTTQGLQTYTMTIKYDVLKDTVLADSLTYKKVQNITVETIGGVTTSTDSTTEFWGKVNGFFMAGEIDEVIGSIDWMSLLKIPPTVGDRWQCDPDDTTSYAITEALESVTADSLGKSFDGCAKIKMNTANEDLGRDSTRYWYAPNVGMVKITDISDGSTFNLISYTVK